MVRVGVETSVETSTMMFNAMDKDVEDGLTSSTAVVEPNSDGSLIIAVENHTGCSIFLEGHQLGTLEPIEIMPTPPNLCFLSQPSRSADVDRKNELLRGLNIEETLEETHRKKLYMLIE